MPKGGTDNGHHNYLLPIKQNTQYILKTKHKNKSILHQILFYLNQHLTTEMKSFLSYNHI